MDRIWPQLPPDLAERIACCLSGNERACSLRLVNRAAAQQFRGPEHTTIRLSQPVPHHAFARHWGAPGATRGMSLTQRQQLMSLTAASGSICDLEVAQAAAGCPLSDEAFTAAGAAGDMAMCKWLSSAGKGSQTYAMLKAAAGAEHTHVLEMLGTKLIAGELQLASYVTSQMAEGAARGGRVGLLERLLREQHETFQGLAERYRVALLAAAAHGCGLPVLQRLHRELIEVHGGIMVYDGETILAAAAGSPTADWQAKVEWLEGQGYRPPMNEHVDCEAASCTGDVVGRLRWLRGRGYRVYPATVARAGNLAALQYLHAEGVQVAHAELHAAGAGHLHVVAWLVETPGVTAPLTPHLFNAAARSGSLELMAWLHERGCPWDGKTFAEAAAGGNQAVLEWLLERGCPVPDDGSPYERSAANGDLATLRALRRLGCSWGPVGALIGRRVACMSWSVRVLRWLLEEGCPVDWEAVDATCSGWEERSPWWRDALGALLAHRQRQSAHEQR